jgi:hypothetical protein
MASIFRSTDPTTWDDVDGIVVNESAPAPNVQGVAANIAIFVAQAERGPAALTEVGSIGEIFETYGKNDSYGLNIGLKNKKFGRLKIIRAIAADGAVATKAFQSSTTDRITFSAKQGKGAYGNNIQVKIESGSTSGKKYTIHDNNSGAVLPDEVYDNVAITAIDSTTFAASKLVSVVVNSTAAEPTNAAYTNLATGADGTVGNTDYSAAIDLAQAQGAGNVIFLDAYNSTRNGYLKSHVAATQDKMAIICGANGDSVATAVSDVAGYRDTDGRIIYGFPWVNTSINGAVTATNPASWIASIFSQTAPNIDLAFIDNSQFLQGMTGLVSALSRTDYVNLKSAGICAFEQDDDFGFKIKSGVVTQIIDSSKVMVYRRRMADFLTVSVGKFLENYQNAVNSKANRSLVKGSILAFITGLENDGILPKDSEVNSGVAKLVDVESLNTDSTIAAGYFKILWKQRIFSSMRFIVLQAEIGESVVVTAQ